MLANVQQATIKPVITAAVAPGTLVHTDEYAIYARLPAWGYGHKTVCRPELTEAPPGTHKPCRKTLRRGFPRTPAIRHCFSFKVCWGFSAQSGFDLECAEFTCFPSADCVSIAEENGQNACSAWVWDRPVRALSAYAYQEALPLVRAFKATSS